MFHSPRPKLLGDVGHERMQQLEDLIARPSRGHAGFRLGAFVCAVEERLDEFQIPVAVHIPDEMIGRAGRIVEAQRFQIAS